MELKPQARGAAVPAHHSVAVGNCLIVVTGLPRSGTSMLMQMLAAGGVPVLSDDRRLPDEDNPQGYFEFDPVRRLLANSKWLELEKGKAVKIVAPLIGALPTGIPCRVILIERDLDEVLESQQRMLARKRAPERPGGPSALKPEYARIMERTRAILAAWPDTSLLCLHHRDVLEDPLAAARAMNKFLDGGLNIAAMAAAVKPELYRNRAAAIFRKQREIIS